MAARMQDIADLAGVSRPAVAAVLNGSKNSRVSAATREKILFYARQLHYRPNRIARRLTTGTCDKRIGILYTPDVISPCSVIRAEAVALLRNADYQCVELEYDLLTDTLESSMDHFVEFGCAGVLSFACGLGRTGERLPRVGYELTRSGEAAIDREYGIYSAVRHLIEHGHRRIAFLFSSYKPDENPYLGERLSGYARALREAGVTPSPDWHYNCFWDERFDEKFPAFLKHNGITAVACSSDALAVQLVSFLCSAGIAVPGQIAVTGFDGWTYTQSAAVPITTVIQPMRQTAAAMVDRLLEKIAGTAGDDAPEILLSPVLHIGSSCGCPARHRTYLEWEGPRSMLDDWHRTLKPRPEDV